MEIQAYITVFAFIILDVLTGIAQALKNNTLSSDKMREGVYHKLSYVFACTLAFGIEYGMAYLDLGYTAPVVMPVCVYIALTEIVSITENIARLNPELAGSGIFNLLSDNKKRRSEDEK